MNKIRNYWRNKKGITLVWGAFFLILCLMFLGLAVDIAYMYFVKNQLQVAADASSLAGAANLSRTLDNSQAAYGQLSARQRAWKFACKNTAALKPQNAPNNNVYLVSDFNGLSCDNADSLSASSLNGTNNDPDGDIIVGNWSDTLRDCPSTNLPIAEEKFCPANRSTGLEINAVKVIARRTGDNPIANVKNGNNSVSVFLGKIFSILGGQGWPLMNARASAIAKGGLQILPIAICINQCDPSIGITDFNDPNCPGKKFLANPPVNSVPCAVSGTCIPPATNTNTSDLRNFFEDPSSIDLCDKCVDTSQGQLTPPVLNAIEAAKAKYQTLEEITYTNPNDPRQNWTATIQGWRVFVPILIIDNARCASGCAGDCPGDQNAHCNYFVPRMAEVIITKTDTGGGDNCQNCLGRRWKGLTLVGTIPTANPKVSTIGCLTCDEANQVSGSKTRLVR